MYALLHTTPFRLLLLAQAPTLLFSLLIAELFYKFHSFTLECVAFLATWYCLDAIATRVLGIGNACSSERARQVTRNGT